jgi:hypothetical protein
VTIAGLSPQLYAVALSNLARTLLAQEREQREDESLKARALARARAAFEHPSATGSNLRLLAAEARVTRPRRAWQTLLLVAAAIGAAGLAAAGAGYVWTAPAKRLAVPSKVTAAESTHLGVGGGLLPVGRAPDVPAESKPEARVAPATSGGNEGARSLSLQQYARELALLEPARSSIGKGDYASALSALSQHRREFPNGQLSQEREALRVRALWGLGQKPAALAAASAFRKRYPRSTLLSWLKDQGDPSP